MSKRVRVRFAPSPTGPLNVGGLRTALYDYLFAKKHGGDFVLRIEDTDKNREVPGTEKYILEALKWAGIFPDEGPGIGGDYGPYRQSDRKDLYMSYAKELIAKGKAYYAFDSAEEMEAMRSKGESENGHPSKYNYKTRTSMKNSLTLSEEETNALVEAGGNVIIRLKMPTDQTISFTDIVREKVSFDTNELDDKVIMKADGMPTYHLANIVDDHLMEISHVIRGEEWLSSTAHHIFMYDAMGWEPPEYAHLSLILKPVGKGKLSKRDSAKFGFPVFPLEWKNAEGEIEFEGFREAGYLPEAIINFLAFLGWNPGTDQELFSHEELIQAFSLDKVVKSGARFDIEKAKWFNQQYIIKADAKTLVANLKNDLEEKGITGLSDAYLERSIELMKERVSNTTEFLSSGSFLYGSSFSYDDKMIRKKFKTENQASFDAIKNIISEQDPFTAEGLSASVKGYMEHEGLGFGAIFPILRILVSGTLQGPDLFEIMDLVGKEEVLKRWDAGMDYIHANYNKDA